MRTNLNNANNNQSNNQFSKTALINSRKQITSHGTQKLGIKPPGTTGATGSLTDIQPRQQHLYRSNKNQRGGFGAKQEQLNSSLVKEHLQLNATAPINISNLIQSNGSKISPARDPAGGGLRPSTKATARVSAAPLGSPGQSRRATTTGNGESTLNNGISGQNILKVNGSLNAGSQQQRGVNTNNSYKQKNAS